MILTKEQEECVYCHQKPHFYQDSNQMDYQASQITLAYGGWTDLYIGSDENGNIVLRACGDNYTDNYYPKYCPECGRRLINDEKGDFGDI